MYHPKGTEEEDDEDEVEDQDFNEYFYNGISFIISNGEFLFDSDKQENVYFEMVNKENYADKKDIRRIKKNAMSFKAQTYKRPVKWNKSMPFRR